ncbi:MAG: hypothetical protein KDA37_08180, partial [Planctomycetales bacterium]|nr:hypothetical protein [Planctomycetales bacterium]
MSARRNLSSVLIAASVLLGFSVPATAQNLLVNGDLEAGVATELGGWELLETVTGLPGALVNSAQLQDFAGAEMVGEANRQGLWLTAFNGNTGAYANQNRAINADLYQIVPGTPGTTYTFSGSSSFEEFYSGGNTFMDPDSPSGSIMSPTQSRFEIAFLDAGGAVIGTPSDIDLRTVHPEPPDRTHRIGSVTDTAPDGTVNIRVRAYATDMLFNLPGSQQSAFYDNFSLKEGASPLPGDPELLMNPNLDPQESTEFLGWDVSEPDGLDNLQNQESFSNNPNTGGALGAWFRPFITGDASFSQTVSGEPGGDYTFSARAAGETFWPGGILGTGTEMFMELAFLDDQEQGIGDPLHIDLREEGFTNAPGSIGANPQSWQQFMLGGTSPEGTAFVRVTAGALGMVAGTGNPQSGFFDDLELTVVTAAGNL